MSGGDSFAIHRTFLRADGSGKAGLPEGDKMMLGSVSGGAVMLSDGPADRLVIAEGIESGLSLLCGLLTEPMIVGAALSANGMRKLHLPKGSGHIKIATDGDPAGREAAKALATRAHGLGWKVSILDAGDGRDFNDILKGVAA
ncbi:toprim domain-containing protein [Altererythrobacter sp. BO-6]|uniref:toprim domain-containing protein n=1 Tax=Altererythrobacter sp. BO-6 TaxID=2604537 RepID=UPI0019D1BA6B|nr:toprim domain-containing protein [Altererythrobacter sp. BO-6]